ncbi:MAG: peptide ABC transporter substrate-binding protein [Chloroflexota bacterium]|nr:peptide ABC transporter substrate-binding protein [Chloroflexota bacterium]
MKSRWILIALVAMAAMLFSACTAAPAAPAAEGEAAAPAEAGEAVTLDTVFSTEPPSLDPSLGSDTQSVWAVRQMFMGLTGFNEAAEVVPSLATEWSVSEDGLTWTYKMRDDVNWVKRDADTGEFEDLGPVTAGDVVFAVGRTLDPVEASPYASMLYMIEGAEEFNAADPAAENFEEMRAAVGVTALDDTTVEFKLKKPTGYFPAITGLWITFPQYAPAVEEHAEQWTEPGNIVTNGPYTLETWQHGAYMRYVKNPLWFDAANVQIEVIQGPIIESESTAMSMYEANEIDMMADPGWSPPLPDMDRIKADAALSEELLIAPRTCTYYYGFVNAKPPFDNPLVRKAFAAAVDRQSLIDNLLKGEQVPAHSFVSPGNFGNAAGDMDIAPWMVMEDYAAQLDQARAWLAEAGYPEGEGLDVLLMYNTSEAHAQVAQAVQAMWSEAFPQATVSVENQEWQVYLNTLLPDAPLEEKPHIYRLGWCADFPDAANWLIGVFRSNSDQNYAMFNSPEFDALVDEADSISDPARREELYKQAEQILVDDVTAIAPLYYYTYVRLYKPWMTNIVISPVTGDPIHEWTIDTAAKAAARQ